MNRDAQITPNQEDAFHFLVRYLREGRKSEYGTYGYDVYLPNIMRAYLIDIHKIRDYETDRYLPRVSPPFYAAAWDLCRRGIIRPGIRAYREQTTDAGSGGDGYSITPFGQQWLQESNQDDYVPIEPGRFAKMLDAVGKRFGPGYRERTQEAIRCYGAHAYLASCAMCGAATESLILAIAIAKKGDEETVVQDYSAKGGRGRIEKLILGQERKSIQDEFRSLSSLLKYWRDVASHGQVAGIGDNEAYTSLALLLRLSKLASDKWSELTRNP